MPRYIVTPEAGPKVAGRAAAAGAVLDLTEFEARAELVAGALAPAPEPAVAAPLDGADAGEATDAPAGRKRR